MNVLPLFLFGLLLISGSAFLLGWRFSDSRLSAKRKRDSAYNRTLEADIDDLATRLDSDAARTGIDTGKEYVVYRVQATLDDIRAEQR